MFLFFTTNTIVVTAIAAIIIAITVAVPTPNGRLFVWRDDCEGDTEGSSEPEMSPLSTSSTPPNAMLLYETISPVFAQ